MLLPSDLLAMAKRGQYPESPVSLDTETSGLHVDSGARVSTVSVAWTDELDDDESSGRWEYWLYGDFPEGQEGERRQEITESGIQTYGMEKIDEWVSLPVVSFAWPFDQGVAGTGKLEDSGQTTLWPDTVNLGTDEWDALMEWTELVGRKHGLVMHNSKFDIHMCEAGTRLTRGKDLSDWVIWDTQNLADLLWGMTGTTSLKPTSRRLWGEAEGDEQDVIKRYLAKMKLPSGRWDLMPWDVIAKYADQDARLTIRMWVRQQMDLSGAKVDGWLDGQNGRLTADAAVTRRLDTTKMLRRMERRGVPFATEAAIEASSEIQRRIRALEKQLPFPPTVEHAKQYYFGEGTKRGVTGLGRTPYAVTETGAPQMDKAVVVKMVRDGLPHAETWRDIQKLQTADSKWYSGWAAQAGDDRRLRTSVRQNGTVSGRFSVEGLQLHAIPHDYRLSNFEVLNGIPTPRDLIGMGVPEGYKLWELDLQQAELRIAAMFAQCARMLELIFAGADLHADAATQLFEVGPGDGNWGEMRQVAKRFNFSAIFGIGKDKLSGDIEEQTGIYFSPNQTGSLLNTWNATYPEYRRAIHDTMGRVEDRMRSKDHGKGYGWINLTNGERRWFRPGEETHKAFNQRVQPNLAQFGIDWWLDVEAYLMGEFGDSIRERIGNPEEYVYAGRIGLVLTVHDSMVLLLPDDDRGLAAVEYAVESGVALWRERFPEVPGGVDAKEWGDHS